MLAVVGQQLANIFAGGKRKRNERAPAPAVGVAPAVGAASAGRTTTLPALAAGGPPPAKRRGALDDHAARQWQAGTTYQPIGTGRCSLEAPVARRTPKNNFRRVAAVRPTGAPVFGYMPSPFANASAARTPAAVPPVAVLPPLDLRSPSPLRTPPGGGGGSPGFQPSRAFFGAPPAARPRRRRGRRHHRRRGRRRRHRSFAEGVEEKLLELRIASKGAHGSTGRRRGGRRDAPDQGADARDDRARAAAEGALESRQVGAPRAAARGGVRRPRGGGRRARPRSPRWRRRSRRPPPRCRRSRRRRRRAALAAVLALKTQLNRAADSLKGAAAAPASCPSASAARRRRRRRGRPRWRRAWAAGDAAAARAARAQPTLHAALRADRGAPARCAPRSTARPKEEEWAARVRRERAADARARVGRAEEAAPRGGGRRRRGRAAASCRSGR